MSEFFDKYANAKAIRTLTLDEVKPGMVVRITGDYSECIAAYTFRVTSTPLGRGGADLIELLEDMPDPREELARRLHDGFANGRQFWSEITDNTREVFRRLADEAMRWADERADQ